MLENAVHPIAELRAVKNQADQLKTTSGAALTYEEYSRLVLSAAASYDTKLLPRARQGTSPPARRSVYMQDLMDHLDSVHDTVDDVYGVDTDIDVIQANVSNQQHVPGSRMPFPRWKSLSPDMQSIWDTISDPDKAIILGIGTSPLRRVRFHDIAGTGFEDDAAAESTDLTLVDTESLVSSSGTTDPASTMLAHASTTQKRT
jgi:hypothetical protein